MRSHNRVITATLFAAMLFTALAVSLGAPVAANAAAPVTVIVVDTQRVLEESKAGRAFQSQMREKVQAYQKGISQQDQQFYAERQELERQRTILGQEAFQAKAKDFEQRIGDASKKAQETQREIAQGENQARTKIATATEEIVQQLAKEHNASLVLAKQTVLFFDPSYDVTEETVKRLDQSLPTLTVTFPSAPPSGSTSSSGKKK